MQLFPLISATELLDLFHKESVIIIDAGSGADAEKKYRDEHLDGAIYIDLNTQLADIKSDASMGGRHPLPTPQQFSKTISALGINPKSHVIIYDDKNGSNAAARFWWMMKAAGHQMVQVLNGGFQAAINAGFPVNDKSVEPLSVTSYNIDRWHLPIADINETEKASKDKNFLIIDVRDELRYNGEKEPIDLVAGHIPNAVNIPFISNLNDDGSYLSPDKLKHKYEQAFKTVKKENIIVHCGSGVTACHTLLAIAAAGLEIPKLYVGSWSEWSRTDRPVEKK